MGRRVRIYAIVGIALLAVIAVLLILYFFLGIFHFDNGGFTFWLLILWAAVVACTAFLLHHRVLKRERLVRRLYLSDEGIYNFEIGYLPFNRVEGGDDAYLLVLFAATSLVEMSYGYEVASLPDDFQPRLMIETDWLRFHRPEGDEGGAVIDQWKGSLKSISSLDADGALETLGTYGNAKELALLIDRHLVCFAGRNAGFND